MEVHIGKVVSELISQEGMSKTEFAQKMHYSKQNINSLLKKDDWSCIQVYKSSIILKTNLFEILAMFPKIKRFSTKKNVSNLKNCTALELENELLKLALRDKERIIALYEKAQK